MSAEKGRKKSKQSKKDTVLPNTSIFTLSMEKPESPPEQSTHKGITFEEWLNKKNREAKEQQEKEKLAKIQLEKKTLEEQRAINERLAVLRKWKTKQDFDERELRAIENINKMQAKQGQWEFENIFKFGPKDISDDNWDAMKQRAAHLERGLIIKPLQLGNMKGNDRSEPGKYLTKHEVKPDHSFKARFRHLLEEAERREPSVTLDGDFARKKEEEVMTTATTQTEDPSLERSNQAENETEEETPDTLKRSSSGLFYI